MYTYAFKFGVLNFMLPSRRPTKFCSKLLSSHNSLNRLHYVSKRLFRVGCLYHKSSVSKGNAVFKVGDILNTTVLRRTGQRSPYSDWLRAGQSGDRIPVGVEIFCTCPDRLWGPPSLLFNGYRVFPGG